MVFPDDCRICGQPLREISRIPVCSACLSEPQPLIAEYFCISAAPFLNAHPLMKPPLRAVPLGSPASTRCIPTAHEGTLRKLIHLFKYGKIRPLARPFGDLLSRDVPREQRFDCVVPMPLHWRRRWERGFNQSELLAREIARRWNVPVQQAVKRVKATASQAGLTNAKRRANVSGAFAMRRGIRLDGARVLLSTTCSPPAHRRACARVLKRAGAVHVALVAVARN